MLQARRAAAEADRDAAAAELNNQDLEWFRHDHFKRIVRWANEEIDAIDAEISRLQGQL
jgi:hypothetical protein